MKYHVSSSGLGCYGYHYFKIKCGYSNFLIYVEINAT